jgi:hypothetical protein
VFASYINKTRKSPPTPCAFAEERETKKRKRREKEERGREGKRRKRRKKKNVRDEIECGRLLDFAIEDKFYLSKNWSTLLRDVASRFVR